MKKTIAEMMAINSKVKVPIGSLLLADEIILPQDLELALEHQKHTNQRLGEILVRFGALDPSDLDRTLELQQSGHDH